MIIVTRPDATEEQIDHIVDRIRSWGLKTEVSRGEMRVVIGVIGPEDKIREKPLGAFPGVESVTPVLKPYKLVAYEFRGTTFACSGRECDCRSAKRSWSWRVPARSKAKIRSR